MYLTYELHIVEKLPHQILEYGKLSKTGPVGSDVSLAGKSLVQRKFKQLQYFALMNDAEVKKKCQFKISNRFAAL
jgi:hypothetical protein